MTIEPFSASTFKDAETIGNNLLNEQISGLYQLRDGLATLLGASLNKSWELSAEAQDILDSVQHEYNILSEQGLHEVRSIAPPSEPTAGGTPRLGGGSSEAH